MDAVLLCAPYCTHESPGLANYGPPWSHKSQVADNLRVPLYQQDGARATALFPLGARRREGHGVEGKTDHLYHLADSFIFEDPFRCIRTRVLKEPVGFV